MIFERAGEGLAEGRAAVLDRLRVETRVVHRRLEEQLALTRPDLSLEEYRDLLGRFLAFWREWFPLIRRNLLEPAFTGPRDRTGLIEHDLAVLGADPDSLAASAGGGLALPAIGCPASALGSMYVLEGSTLGGQVVTRHLEATLGLSGGRGCAYFRSYGPAVGSMWRAFRVRLARQSSVECDDIMVRSAHATFETLEAVLCPGAPEGRV